MIGEKKLRRWMIYWQGGAGYHVLLVLLLSMFVLTPLVDKQRWGGVVIESVLVFILVQALTVVCRRRRQRIIGLILFVPVFAHWLVLGDHSVLRLLPEVGSTVLAQTLMGVGSALFFFYLVYLTVAEIFRRKSITWAQVSAATSSYLMLGIAWRSLYQFLHQINSESFRGLEVVAPDGELIGVAQGSDFLYFSFVTMTTLGYGDIVPVSEPARMLVVLQAIVGQLFLVILVARLVGMVGDRGEATPKDE